ncbi:membrane-targeted effector domain-containing toxin [Pseudomonas sp. SED1]|uniref:membrane-targeted effector domain-containing toxin n=1 Tax=Pseudomonas sp. SED1 TaxID=3056845 RepID=UPI00296F08DB|nr:membrane-targeted effector domain-containing toxin [Pseudomonas sp. SED1]MDY0833443.1 membrane-targeted effector domain-containing toxin [Pseudomonas sp. SED1]
MPAQPPETTSLAPEQLNNYLLQIGHRLQVFPNGQAPSAQSSAELLAVQVLHAALAEESRWVLQNAQVHYTLPRDWVIQGEPGLLNRTRISLALHKKLASLEIERRPNGHLRKNWILDSHQQMLEAEVKLKVADRLLNPGDQQLVMNIVSGPELRPGIHRLTFRYRQQTIEFAGAFVLTRSQAAVTHLETEDGDVVLFTPSRGLEAFTSLKHLDRTLRERMGQAAWRQELLQHLPRRHQHLHTASIWPLVLSPVDSVPLNEHTYSALQEKQRQDIAFSLGLDGHPAPTDVAQMALELDRALRNSPWHLTSRLELRAQQLLEKLLLQSAPDWYRSASEAQRSTLAAHLRTYEHLSLQVLARLGPAASPEAMARVQLLEHLDEDLDIQGLIPEQLQISTERTLKSGNSYRQYNNLVQLAVRGLHRGDEHADSAFLKHTQLTYAQQSLPPEFQDITPAYLADLLARVQPSLNFAEEQKRAHSFPAVQEAMQQMLDSRLHALAYCASLQNHISADDYVLLQTLSEGPSLTLTACCLFLHKAPLKDLWVLRQTDATGAVKRLLLCTPHAPRAEQFQAFGSERELQAHILGWSQEVTSAPGSRSMKDYLLEQVVSRIRPKYSAMLSALGFIPANRDYLMISFGAPSTYEACLVEMSTTTLAMQADEYLHQMPNWLSQASAADRQKLADLKEQALGAAQAYGASPGSPQQFPDFDRYLHKAAKTALNQLLGNPTPAVDPNLVGVITPRERVSYTTLYRNGYDASLGFINPDASTTAQFKGPPGVDLSRLTAQTVSNSVRGIWVGDRYVAEVEKTLLDPQHASYGWHRGMALEVTQLHMRVAALECCLQGYLASADLVWLEKSIDSLADNSNAVRNLYRLYPLHISGQVIDGCYLFHHANNLPLLYTPNAPDGIAFRPQREFNERLKNLEGMDTYYISRVASVERAAFEPKLQALVTGLPAQLKGVYSKPVFDEVPRTALPLKDLHYHSYDKPLRHRIDKVKNTTSGRLQMIVELVSVIGEITIAVLTAPFPALSLALGGLLVFKDSMLALHAYSRNQTAVALGHYLGALLNAGGALLTDLRPLLFAPTRLIRPPLRHIARAPKEQQAITLIKQLQPQSPVPQGMQPVLLGGDNLWASHTPDSLGRFLLFRYDTTSGQLRSTGKLVSQTADGQWQRSGVIGGMPGPERLGQPYELSEKYRTNVAAVIAPEDRSALFLQIAFLDRDLNTHSIWISRRQLDPALRQHLDNVKALTDDADAFFARLPAVVPRAETLNPAPDIAVRDLLKLLIDDAHNLVVGEAPFSTVAKQVLIENMQYLRELDVTVLYIEPLWRDIHHLKTHSRFSSGFSKRAEGQLKSIDKENYRDPEGLHGHWMLVKTAQQHGIEVRSLNASSSYDLENTLCLVDSRPAPIRSTRLTNFYSHTIINDDQTKKPGERWIALVDQKRMSTYRGTPGLADLQKSIALRVDDAFEQPTQVIADVAGGIPGDVLAKADLKLSLSSAGRVAAPAQRPGPWVERSHSLRPTRPLPAEAPRHFSTFDLPQEHLSLISDEITLPMGTRDALFATAYRETASSRRAAQTTFDQTRTKLRAQAQAFFTEHTPPARVVVPPVEAALDEARFIDQLLDIADGLVVGEAHSSTSSKGFLSRHMEYLKGQREVKTLYMEQLTTELHQADLDIVHSLGFMPDELWSYLNALDKGHGVPADNPYSFVSLVQVAMKHNVRIRALDCVASLRVDGMTASRTSMFNYFATQVIRADQLQHGPHKWVALVGETHLNTHRGVPGIADLNKGISVLLDDVPPGSATGFLREPAAVLAMTREQQWPLVRYDFKKNVEVAGAPLPQPVVPALTLSLEQRLRRKGDYLLQRTLDDGLEMVHKNRDGVLVHTALQQDARGHFVNRWNLDDRRFISREALIDIITTIKKMRQVQ